MAALEEVEARCGEVSGGPAPPPVAPAAAPPALAVNAGASPAPERPPPAPREPSSLGRGLTRAAFMTSGAAALSSILFGALAARSARRCARAEAYDQRFIDECEERGPRYQALWQGFAVATGAFLGVGLALWWSEARARPARASGAVTSGLALHGRF